MKAFKEALAVLSENGMERGGMETIVRQNMDWVRRMTQMPEKEKEAGQESENFTLGWQARYLDALWENGPKHLSLLMEAEKMLWQRPEKIKITSIG